VFWKGGNGGLWHQYSTGGGWSAQQDMRLGTIGGPPRAVAQPDGAVDVFWRGSTGNHLWLASYVPRPRWRGAAGPRRRPAPPPPTAAARGMVNSLWKGAGGARWTHFQQAGAAWSAPSLLGLGTLGSRPWATGEPDGTMDVFWRGSADDNLWLASYVPGRGWRGP